MKRTIAAAALVAAAGTAPALAQDLPEGAHDYGFAGLMSRNNRADLAPLTLASGRPVAEKPYALKSGVYYRLPIEADGSAELALSGGDFFRAIWINEIVVNDIEIRPMGVHSIEFELGGQGHHVLHRHRARDLQAVDPRLAWRQPSRNLRHPVIHQRGPAMTRYLIAALIAAAPAMALADATPDQLARIDEVLAGMKCEVDHANVELEEGIFDLDDVICADGQYDIKLDGDYKVVEQRKE